MELAKKLREVRDLLGKSQMQVSKDTGINNKTLSGYERGVSEPDLSTIKLLADYYSTSVDYLLGNNDVQIPICNQVGGKESVGFASEIDDLSTESKKELEKYIQLLKLKDTMDKSKDEQSCTLEKEA